jgi:phenylalanyl-tRNA synthetase alpha chain
MTPMTQDLERIEAEAGAAIGSAPSSDALEKLEVEYLGRNGKLTGLLRGIGSLPPEQKPLFGSALNAAKDRLTVAIGERKAGLKAAERAERERAEAIDVTLPGRPRPRGRVHPLTLTVNEVKRTMIGLGFEFQDAPDIEDYHYNFDWLNYPPDHPAMDEQDTFYIEGSNPPGRYLLRTQTTALQGHVFSSGRKPPFRIATIGRCFRNEAVDATHSHTFHQVDGFSVAEGISLADLKGVLAAIFRGLFGPDAEVRFRPDFFPFVEPGVEVAVRWVDAKTGTARWLEMGGAGLIHPNILNRAGYDSERYTGFAFGLGIDRMPMRRYGVDDLRLFLDNDLRFLQQF